MTKLLSMNICGTCGKKFKTKTGYLNHTCKETGFKPNTVEHLNETSGGRFSLQSEKAIERGDKRKGI